MMIPICLYISDWGATAFTRLQHWSQTQRRICALWGAHPILVCAHYVIFSLRANPSCLKLTRTKSNCRFGSLRICHFSSLLLSWRLIIESKWTCLIATQILYRSDTMLLTCVLNRRDWLLVEKTKQSKIYSYSLKNWHELRYPPQSGIYISSRVHIFRWIHYVIVLEASFEDTMAINYSFQKSLCTPSLCRLKQAVQLFNKEGQASLANLKVRMLWFTVYLLFILSKRHKVWSCCL